MQPQPPQPALPQGGGRAGRREGLSNPSHLHCGASRAATATAATRPPTTLRPSTSPNLVYTDGGHLGEGGAKRPLSGKSPLAPALPSGTAPVGACASLPPHCSGLRLPPPTAHQGTTVPIVPRRIAAPSPQLPDFWRTLHPSLQRGRCLRTPFQKGPRPAVPSGGCSHRGGGELHAGTAASRLGGIYRARALRIGLPGLCRPSPFRHPTVF